MKSALLVLNGPRPSGKLLRAAAAGAGIVACADGGLKNALACGLSPRVVIGDMDSRPRRTRPIRELSYICDFDENRSDFEKSLDWLRAVGCRRVLISGVRGGRLDHEMVNWAVVRRWSRRLEIVVIDAGFAHHVGKGLRRFPGAKGRTVSLVADSGSTVVTTSGLRYPLKKERLPPGSRGLSNATTRESFSVQVHRGGVWVVMPDNPANPLKSLKSP